MVLSNGARWEPTVVEDDIRGETTYKSAETISTTSSGRIYTAINKLTLDNGIVDINNADTKVEVLNLKGAGIINLCATETDDGYKAGTFKATNVTENAELDVKLIKNAETKQEFTADELTPDDAKKLLTNVGGNNVKTQTTVKEGLVENGFGINDKNEVHLAGANKLMQSTLGLATSTPLLLNRIMVNNVRKRLGDIRSTTGTQSVWARYDGGQMSGEAGLETDFSTIQVGSDIQAFTPAFRLGAALNWTEADGEYQRGTSELTACGFVLYGTWVADNGSFVDVVGRVAKADTDLTVDELYKGEVENTVWSLSGELGHRFEMNSAWYVEPQIEVAYTRVEADNFSLGDAGYHVDTTDSLLGRAGVAIGAKLPENRGDVYMHVSAVHEYMGDAKISGRIGSKDNAYEIDGKDTWVEFGFGSTYMVQKNAYIYADIERTAGGQIDEDWRLTAGARLFW